jgi:hypothetical protein
MKVQVIAALIALTAVMVARLIVGPPDVEHLPPLWLSVIYAIVVFPLLAISLLAMIVIIVAGLEGW